MSKLTTATKSTAYWGKSKSNYYFERSAQAIFCGKTNKRRATASSDCSSCSCGIGGCGDGGGCDGY